MDQQQHEQFLAAVELFNSAEFFACHDVLEEIWSETLGPDRPFLQGLIHAAVALFHFSEGNLGGGRKMHDSALAYLSQFGAEHAGIDLGRFRKDFDRCFEPLLGPWREYPAGIQINESLLPRLHFTSADM